MNTLIITPHADDEVLGCSSYLNSDTVLMVVGIDESRVPGNRPTFDERTDECNKMCQKAGVEVRYFHNFVNHYAETKNEIIKGIENLIKEYKPNTVLIPYKDTNQDHQTVNECAMIALRHHDEIPFVPNVLEYESPGGFFWGPEMEPNVFRGIDFNWKMQLWDCYKTQHRNYRSIPILTLMARKRGVQSDYIYAEGFRALRLCQG